MSKIYESPDGGKTVYVRDTDTPDKPITVTRLKKDKNDIQYELRNAFSEVIQEIVEKHCDEEM